MLFLVFHVGEDRYAIKASCVVEVLPLVHWKRVPSATDGVVGVLNYHGTPVPLIDLTELMTEQPSRRWMSTRIILVNHGVNHEAGSGNGTRLLGLLAEQVTETLRQTEEDFRHSSIATSNAPYLGRIAVQPSGMIQRIEIENLLPADVLSRLFLEEVEPA